MSHAEDEPVGLLNGYIANQLTPEEEKILLESATADQEVFNLLMETEAIRDALSSQEQLNRVATALRLWDLPSEDPDKVMSILLDVLQFLPAEAASTHPDSIKPMSFEHRDPEAFHRQMPPVGLRSESKSEENLTTDLFSLSNKLYTLGRRHQAANRLQSAEAAYMEAVSMQRQIVKENPTVAYTFQLSRTLNALGRLYVATNRLNDAEVAYIEAISIQRLNQQQISVENVMWLPLLVAVLNDLSDLYRISRRVEEAEAAKDEALALQTAIQEFRRIEGS
jgi:tetratricopeptide (TPR) repeat protein